MDIPRRKQQGLLFVVSAPSGAGKTTLCKAVVPQVPHLQYSVSYTTRASRTGETDGKDYFFTDLATFKEMIEKNEFIEWACVHGNFYGTALAPLRHAREQGLSVIMDLDTQGAATLRKTGEGIYIYILPPSMAALSERLVNRRSDTDAEILMRLQKSREEILNYSLYDYVVINAEFNVALEELKAILLAERVRRDRINPAWVDETLLAQPGTPEEGGAVEGGAIKQ